MGLLADFFVTSTDQALLYEESLADRQSSVAKYQPAEYRNQTGLELGILWAMLEGDEWDVNKHMLTEVKFGDGGETWLLQFPRPLLEHLAGLDDEQLEYWATRWAGIEELELWEPHDTKELLIDLRRLCNQALSTGNDVFMWGSL